MNDSKNSSNGLLVLKIPQVLGKEMVQLLTDHITPIADQLGLEPMVLDGGADIRIEKGTDALLERVCVALEALVKQGEPPEVSEAQIAPQALNARPTGLNSRPTEADTLRACMERSFREREHRQLGQFITNLGKPTDG